MLLQFRWVKIYMIICIMAQNSDLFLQETIEEKVVYLEFQAMSKLERIERDMFETDARRNEYFLPSSLRQFRVHRPKSMKDAPSRP